MPNHYFFSLANAKGIMEEVTSLPILKTMIACVVFAYTWLFDGLHKSVLAIAALIILDTIMGFAKSYKKSTVSSRGFFRFALKCFLYSILLATGSLVDKVIPAPFVFSVMVSFLAVTEGISIIENAGELGAPIPKFLLRRLKVMQEVDAKEDER